MDIWLVFNHAAYTIYFLTLLNYITVLVRIWSPTDLIGQLGECREDGSVFSIVEVAKVFIVKWKHGACAYKTNTKKNFVENCTRRNLCVYVVFYIINLYYNQRMK